MKKILAVMIILLFLASVPATNIDMNGERKVAHTIKENESEAGQFEVQWEKSYGKLVWWSARYEGPQPVGDADNDGKNELLIGGRDPFMRVMKWNGNTYVEQAKILDPAFGIGYSVWMRIGDNWFNIPEPFGSATGFFIGDADNDGKNEVGVAWGRHFSAFKWDGRHYRLLGKYIVIGKDKGGTTLDCIVGDADNDGKNEVLVTGGFDGEQSLIMLKWDGKEFKKMAGWGRRSIYFPWIADVDGDGKNEVIVGDGRSLYVLKWNGVAFDAALVDKFDYQVFGCVGKDSDGDGMPEIHVTFGYPRMCIYKWNGSAYNRIFDISWPNEDDTIEAIDVGDVDDDGMPEVAVGTNHIHIFRWNGATYNEIYTINTTYGGLAVTCIGDFDNDGKNEINAGNVWRDSEEQDYREWIFKYQS